MKRGIRNIRIPIMVRIMTGSTLGKTTPEDVARAFAAHHIMPQFYAGRLGVPFIEEPQTGQDRPLTFSGTKAGGKVSPADTGPTSREQEEREKIITAMCYTKRHDYGFIPPAEVNPADGSLFRNWMTEEERQGLRTEMAQLFEHHIEPIIKERDQAQQEQKITEMMLNRARGFRDDMTMVTMLDDQTLDWWREMRLQAHSDSEQLKLISAALRRAGIEEKKDTPPHATVSLLAAQYLRLLEGKTPAGMVAMDRERMEQLLAIERGHRSDRDKMECYGQEIQAIYRDLGEWAKSLGFETTAPSAAGSRKRLLGEAAAHIGSLESEVAHLRKKNHEMQVVNARHIFSPFQIAEIDGKPLEHYLELERLAQAHGVEKIVDAHAERKGELLALMAVLGRAATSPDPRWMVQEIDRLKEKEKWATDQGQQPTFFGVANAKDYTRDEAEAIVKGEGEA